MRWYFVGASESPKLAVDLIYCEQDLTVFFRDIVGTPPYNLATELVYCEQDLTVLNRTP